MIFDLHFSIISEHILNLCMISFFFLFLRRATELLLRSGGGEEKGFLEI